jgi:hypothetical protein
VYGFYLAWFFRPLRWVARDTAEVHDGPLRASLATSEWTPESNYQFWEGVAQGFVHFVTAGFLLLFGLMLAFRPTGTAEEIGLFGLRAWGGFFGTGFVLIAASFFRVWFRRRAGKALSPRTNGWWMLVIQLPAAVAFALATR